MTGTRLTLVVLRAGDLEGARAFYAALGIAFQQERHGDGPLHYAGRAGDVLLELYPIAEGAGPDVTTRVGFSVPDLGLALRGIEAAGARVAQAPADTDWGRRAVVRDPDGRKVELWQA